MTFTGMPIITKMNEMNIPKSDDANAVPSSIEYSVTGLLKSISRVFCRASQGIIMGVIDDDVKNDDNAINAGMLSVNEIPLPTTNASHRNKGMRMPITMVGPLK